MYEYLNWDHFAWWLVKAWMWIAAISIGLVFLTPAYHALWPRQNKTIQPDAADPQMLALETYVARIEQACRDVIAAIGRIPHTSRPVVSGERSRGFSIIASSLLLVGIVALIIYFGQSRV